MYNPSPKRGWIREPRRMPIKVVPSYIGDDGIVGNWLFYNGGGDVLRDFSRNGNHGTINGAVWRDGPFGWSLYFDGVDDWVEIPDDPSLDITEPVSWGGWARTETESGIPLIMSKSDGSNYVTFDIRIDYGTLVTSGGFYDGTWHRAAYGWVPSSGEWHFYFVTYDGSTIRLYVDGVEVGTHDTTAAWPTGTGSLAIGRYEWGGSNYIDGTAKSVRIYDRALSASEISRKFEEMRGIFGV